MGKRIGTAYCKDAQEYLGINVICGEACPLLLRCPRLIMEDATDQGVSKAILAMKELYEKSRS